MWPFKKKDKKEDVLDLKIASIRELEGRVFSAFPIGKRFSYLGVKMVVTDHCHYVPDLLIGRCWLPENPSALVVEYVNKNGEITQHKFTTRDAEKLLVKNRKSHETAKD